MSRAAFFAQTKHADDLKRQLFEQLAGDKEGTKVLEDFFADAKLYWEQPDDGS